MPKRHDVCVIGLGPAGMAATWMAAHLGLDVLAIERRSLGGASVRSGCIPSKALLRAAAMRHGVRRWSQYGLGAAPPPEVADPLRVVREHVALLTERTRALLDPVGVALQEGIASVLDPHTVEVGGHAHRAKRIFVCVGSRPALPPVPGLGTVPYLTHETLFSLERIPESLVILGGGAVGAEMAQAFSRLGSRVAMVHMDAHLLPHGDPDAGALLEEVFRDEGIEVYHRRALRSVQGDDQGIVARTDHGETLVGEKLLVAAGRTVDLSALRLERAGVECGTSGVHVDRHLRTTCRSVYAAGDCIGWQPLSHAARHQGMIALVNAVLPRPLGRDARRYVVPWVVFTDPPVAHVGRLERDLRAAGADYEVIEERYEDHGAAIAGGNPVGYVRALVSATGRIYGVGIVGEGAPEMINEWGLAIQERLRIHRILLLQHAFPSMSTLVQRVAERWMLRRTGGPRLRRLIRRML
jgi:pyruvate/2-oxoglutarate dehydrogenase complex dihydrolipoamide dehydrogenase (E3) component